jgi:DNA-binding NtrC family response regulator
MRIRRDNQDVVVCVLTTPIAVGDMQIGVLALEREAQSQSYQKDELHFLVALAHIVAPFFTAIERIEDLEAENRRLRYAEEKQAMMVGSSKAMARLHRTIRTVAPSIQPVLILGQTGTGKELVASLLHELSNRSDGPFVTVNCAAIPRELFESEFFGYEKGAFTGALQRKNGLMEQSDGGTLFLDEIGDLSLEHQARILRAVETGRFRRIGGKEEIAVNIRVVAATNKDLVFEIQEGTFREDLYHRLRAVEIQVPPLNQRTGDIPELAAYFLEAACIRAKRVLQRFSPKAIEYLMERSWPGNIRQLKNVVETANTFCRSDVIDVDDLPATMSDEDAKNKPQSLEEMERQHLVRTLEFTDGNILQTAKILGIGRSTLYVKLAQYGLK